MALFSQALEPPSNPGRFIEYLRRTNKALVFWQHPLAQKSGEQAAVVHKFVSDLHRTYPDLGIFKDPPDAALAEHVRSIQGARLDRLPTHIIIDAQFGVEGTGDSNKIANNLAKSGRDIEKLNYFRDTKKPHAWAATSALVVVITGSSGPELAELVRDLGEKGFLKNNYIVFESCGEALSDRLVSEIVGRFGAEAAYHFAGRIHEKDAAVLLEAILKEKINGSASKLQTVPARAINRNQPKLIRPMAGAWTICDVWENTPASSPI